MNISTRLAPIPCLTLPPRWWPADAVLALDFTAGLAMADGDRCALSGLLACTRPGTAHAPDKYGALLPFDADRLRLTNRGLLVEESRQNLLADSFAPAAQDVALEAGNYVLSLGGGGSATASGATTGSADAQTPLPFSLASAGTVSLALAGDLDWFQLEAGTFATSPIETGAGPAIRYRDIVSLQQTQWITPQSCTILVEWEQVAPGEGVQNMMRWENTSYHRLRSGNGALAQIKDGDANLILNAGAGAVPPAGIHRLVTALAPDDMAVAWSASITGSAGLVTDQSGTPETSPTSAYLGSNGNDEPLNGWLRKLVIWPLRLSDTECAALCA